MARKALSKKIRFDVFKRDGFRCQYCGDRPDDAKLQVDHIAPVAEGGGDEPDNLVTSCQPCNSGKGARPLGETLAPFDPKKRTVDLRERREQLEAYAEWVEEWNAQHAAFQDRQVVIVVSALFGQPDQTFTDDDAGRRARVSILGFVKKLGIEQVVDAAEITYRANLRDRGRDAFKYFCGVCWRKLRAQEQG